MSSNINIKLEILNCDRLNSFAIFTNHTRCMAENKKRIALGKQTFQKKKNVLTNKHVSTDSKKKKIYLECYSVWM